MRKLIETIGGSGTVTSSSGEHTAVHYLLHIYQNEIPVGNMQTIPGLKRMPRRGNLWVILGFSGEADRGIDGTYGMWNQRTAVVALS